MGSMIQFMRKANQVVDGLGFWGVPKTKEIWPMTSLQKGNKQMNKIMLALGAAALSGAVFADVSSANVVG